MEIHTIGFTKKSAEEFFEALKKAGIRRVVDIRLHNTSQLAAFTKRDDLAYFLKQILGAEYAHEPLLAPTEEILKGYKGKKIKWEDYERMFTKLLKERRVESTIDRKLFSVPAALLCSEAEPDKCHRRIAAEYLAEKWGGVKIIHL
ncbi:MAG TPA: DUF488 domain-containing protein [bacterium]|nr:DUF488 domain-containing protein [bacterium]